MPPRRSARITARNIPTQHSPLHQCGKFKEHGSVGPWKLSFVTECFSNQRPSRQRATAPIRSRLVEGLRTDGDAPIYGTTVAFQRLPSRSRSLLQSRAALCTLALVCAACGSDDESAGPSGGGAGGGGGSAAVADGVPASEIPYEPCPVESAVGEFLVTLAADFTSVEGKVEDGVRPSEVPTELQRDGECRLVTLPNLLCDPGCITTTQTCGENNQCLPIPQAHDVGTVTVTGLVRDVAMTPNATTGNYRPGPPALPHPGFAPGADLRVATSGGDYEPFQLRGWGISELELPDPINVSEGQPATITWAPPAVAGPARVYAVLNVNNHGSSNTKIECDFADTGTGVIPATLVDALIARGATGFPTIRLERRTATSVDIAPGCVQLLVSSGGEFDITLSGLISCDDDDSVCPDGQTCKPIERYCE
jgi:hypothetical protein